jgi:hypothetical protein
MSLQFAVEWAGCGILRGAMAVENVMTAAPGMDRRHDTPVWLDGATDTSRSVSWMHGSWIVQTVPSQLPAVWDLLRDAEAGLGGAQGRPRKATGSYALVYLAFVFSHESDVRPWWQRAGHSIWTGAGFSERPAYSTLRLRFIELEEIADVFEQAAGLLIQHAAKATGGLVGRWLHVDATEAETNARLRHLCPPGSACRAKRSAMNVTAGAAMNQVRDERHRLADAPEPEGAAAAAPMIGDADSLEVRDGGVLLRLRDCSYELLDPTAGARAYITDGRTRRFWVGFYNHKAIDHFTGAPVAIKVTSASQPEYLAYPGLLEQAVANTGRVPDAMIADKGFTVRSVFEHNTTRGIATIVPWRAHGTVRQRSDEDRDLHDRHGIPRCKHCGAPTAFASFAKTAGTYGTGSSRKTRGPRLYVRCAAPITAGCEKTQSVACEREYRMLLPLWRTTPAYLALRHSHHRYERVHHHWRVRYRVGADDHSQRPKRRGDQCQQLRANAALLLEWLGILAREDWMPGRKPAPIDPDRLRTDDATEFAEHLHDLRHLLGLHQPYGTAAVTLGVGGPKPQPSASEQATRGIDPADSETPARVVDYTPTRPAWALDPIDPDTIDENDPPF